MDFGGGVRERVCKTWGSMLRGWYSCRDLRCFGGSQVRVLKDLFYCNKSWDSGGGGLQKVINVGICDLRKWFLL